MWLLGLQTTSNTVSTGNNYIRGAGKFHRQDIMQCRQYYSACSTTAPAALHRMHHDSSCSTTAHAALQRMQHYSSCSTAAHAAPPCMQHYRHYSAYNTTAHTTLHTLQLHAALHTLSVTTVVPLLSLPYTTVMSPGGSNL